VKAVFADAPGHPIRYLPQSVIACITGMARNNFSFEKRRKELEKKTKKEEKKKRKSEAAAGQPEGSAEEDTAPETSDSGESAV
jgi:hypothetical protein